MKTTIKVLVTIALFGLFSFSNFAQTEDKSNIFLASNNSVYFPLEKEEADCMKNLLEQKISEFRLEQMMFNTEIKARYVANEFDSEISLESLMAKTEEQIKYVAPKN
jgi:hypothetical protein